jgi:hypothetical protein
VRIALIVLVVLILLLPAGSWYYSSGSRSCAGCHEIRATVDLWQRSTHRNVPCRECHGSVLTLDPGFHAGNLRRLVTHFGNRAPEQIRIRDAMDLNTLVGRCARCHSQEFANWKAGPHSATYARIFLSPSHNRKRLLMDDCLRCHGMHYDGPITALVSPVSTTGPWKLADPRLANLPAIPCLACHQIHHPGEPLRKPSDSVRTPGPLQELMRPSLSLFDRRGLTAVSVKRLPLPPMKDGDRLVRMSPDQRQALCYQCHAPLAGFQVGSGDDRTGIGVHEGLSCLACHQKHMQTTRASCAGCHPRLSNCGLDVEKMDTTFFSPRSKHNVHFVKCVDCHAKGVPKKRASPGNRASSSTEPQALASGRPARN